MCLCVYIYKQTHTLRQRACTRIYLYANTHTHTHTHTRARAHTQAHTSTSTHKHMHERGGSARRRRRHCRGWAWAWALECAQRNPQARANLRHDGDGGPQNDLDDVVVAEQRRDDEQGAEEVDVDVHAATRRTAVAPASAERTRGQLRACVRGAGMRAGARGMRILCVLRLPRSRSPAHAATRTQPHSTPLSFQTL